MLCCHRGPLVVYVRYCSGVSLVRAKYAPEGQESMLDNIGLGTGWFCIISNYCLLSKQDMGKKGVEEFKGEAFE